MDQVIAQHSEWLVAHVGLIWMALGGAALRVLLVLNEPLPRRIGNGVAGMIMALMLSDVTAAVLTEGKYSAAYAVIYGLVAHELVMAVVKFANQHAYPLLHRSVEFFMRLRLRLVPEDKPSPTNEENLP